MLSAAYTGNGTVDIVHAEAEPPPAGHVQVRVAYTGLCGTDLHILHGNMDPRVHTPLVFGHEMSGTVAAVGPESTAGRSATRSPSCRSLWDGTCPACLAGNQHICQNLDFIGIDSPGALQELWNVPAETLVALPPGTRLDHAALVEPVAVAVHDVRRGRPAAGRPRRRHRRRPDRRADRVGRPGVRRRGGRHRAGRAARAQIVRELGFTALDPRETTRSTGSNEWTGGAGADVVFEVSGAAGRGARARPAWPRCGGRSSSSPSTGASRDRPAAAVLARARRSSARGSTSGRTSRRPSSCSQTRRDPGRRSSSRGSSRSRDVPARVRRPRGRPRHEDPRRRPGRQEAVRDDVALRPDRHDRGRHRSEPRDRVRDGRGARRGRRRHHRRELRRCPRQRK